MWLGNVNANYSGTSTDETDFVPTSNVESGIFMHNPNEETGVAMHNPIEETGVVMHNQNEECVSVHYISALRRWSYCSIFKIWILVLLTAVILISVKSRHFLRLPQPSEVNGDSNNFSICEHEGCIDAASDIIRAIDKRFQPCKDFVQFSCGGWIKSNPVPDDSAIWGQYNLLQSRVNVIVRSILENPNNTSDPSPLKQVRTFYAACLNESQLERKGLQPLLNLLDKYGGWPMINTSWCGDDFNKDILHEVLFKYLKYNGVIGMSVGIGSKHMEMDAFYFNEPSFHLAITKLNNLDNNEQYILAYKNYMKTTAKLLAKEINNFVIDKDILDRDVEDVYNFENELLNISINYKESIESVFLNMLLFVNTTDVKILANQFIWDKIQTFSSDSTNSIRETAEEYRRIVLGIRSVPSRNVTCIKKVIKNMGLAIGTQYVKTFLKNTTENDVNDIFENIMLSVKEIVINNKWMDSITKNISINKVNNIGVKIAYPFWYNNKDGLEDYYRDLEPMNEEEHFENMQILSHFNREKIKNISERKNQNGWLESPVKVSASNLLFVNSIELPAAILHPPFYRSMVPKYLNYGSIGMIIGHEIFHGFGHIGRLFDEESNFVTWWSEHMTETIEEKSQCIIDQYQEFKIPELDTDVKKVRINGKLTEDENIADNGGLRAAFLAYKIYIDENGTEPRLPGLTEYTPEQLFFIANAQTWCSSITKKGLAYQINNDVHSPNKFRVMGPMINMEEFSQAWNCPIGSVMNPRKKCRVW